MAIVIILLAIIACCMLFGKENTKNGITSIILGIVLMVVLLAILGSCGA